MGDNQLVFLLLRLHNHDIRFALKQDRTHILHETKRIGTIIYIKTTKNVNTALMMSAYVGYTRILGLDVYHLLIYYFELLLVFLH